MKLKLFLPFFLCGTFSLFSQSTHLSNNLLPSTVIQQHIADVHQKRADSNYIFSATPPTPLFHLEKSKGVQHFPYPIIFIHGLVGSADSWSDFYTCAIEQGWSYGGHIRFNLNSDDDLSFSNITSDLLSDVTDFNSNLPAADFYLINFNCAIDGTSYGGNYNTSTQSNQAAIIKQGLAMGKAVQHVLQATGKDKVILFGHSMGGLTARQYLQNPENWQSDNKHHVAKLVTSGTPHGGSNASLPGLSGFAGVKERSDAVRDLRRSYFYSGSPGVFLYGGLESSSVMNDALLGFYNYDVNCNGYVGNQIVGLNQKNIPIDLDITCIVSDYSLDLTGGDLVVGFTEAQLKSYYYISAETFVINTFHTNMPGFIQTNFEAFDEPDDYHLAYQIKTNTTYHGFITEQAQDAPYTLDYDDFTFKTTEPGKVKILVDNATTFPFGISILKHPNYSYLYNQTYNTSFIETESFQIPAGTYYLELFAQGDSDSWRYPYAFKVVWSPLTPSTIHENKPKINVNVAPNPTTNAVYITLENDDYIAGKVILMNLLGKELQSKIVSGTKITETFYLENYPAGIYFITVQTPNNIFTSKVIKRD